MPGKGIYRPNTWNLDDTFTGFQPARREPMKKYYVGARHIGQSIQHGSNADCTRDTLEDAIADAKEQIRAGTQQCVVIVKIVAIVRRDSPPITVETID